MTDKDMGLLRKRWREKRGRMCKEWRESFEAFKAWCLVRGWTPSVYILAAGPVLGPETTELKQTGLGRDEQHAKEYTPVPGYSHRPCLTCGNKESRCSNPCWMYAIHLDATLARAREIAERQARRMGRA